MKSILRHTRKATKSAKDIALFSTEMTMSRLLRQGGLFESRKLTEPVEIERVRAFATRSFVELGKIDRNDVDTKTWLLKRDDYLSRKIFFGCYARNGELIGTSCLIHTSEMSPAETRMPIGQLSEEGAQFFSSIPRGQVAEIASMAKKPHVGSVAMLSLMRAMMRYAYGSGTIRYLCFGLDPRILPKYEKYFGDIITDIGAGKRVTFDGIVNTPVAPIVMDLGHSIDEAAVLQKQGSPDRVVDRLVKHSVEVYMRE